MSAHDCEKVICLVEAAIINENNRNVRELLVRSLAKFYYARVCWGILGEREAFEIEMDACIHLRTTPLKINWSWGKNENAA